MTHSLKLSTLALLTSVATACGVADETYPGEPLLSVTGTLQNELTGVADVEVSIVWTYDNGEGDELSADRAAVMGSFPAAFSLNLYTPPEGGAADALLAVGFISVLPPGTEPPLDESQLLGISETHLALYLGTSTVDLPPEIREQAVAQFGGDLEAGYYLAEVIPATVDGEFDTFEIVPNDSPVSVRMAPVDALDIPDVH